MVIVSELYNHYNELLRLFYQRGLTESWKGRKMLFSGFNLRQKKGGKISFNLGRVKKDGFYYSEWRCAKVSKWPN